MDINGNTKKVMKAIYYRCSTEKQDFMQQNEVVTKYLQRIGETTELYTVSEKISGSVKHTERKLNELLKQCEKGSTIYISELSRLGRNMTDLFSIVTECSERDITLIQCKDGTIIENKSIGGKALLFALSLASEIELANIRQRTKAGLAARKAKMMEIGGTSDLWGSKNGNRDRITAINKAAEISAKNRKEKAQNNPNNKAFIEFIEYWQAIHGKITANTDFQPIADELNRRCKKTSTGLDFDKKRARAMYVSLLNIYSYE